MKTYEKNKWYKTRNGSKAIIYDLNYQLTAGDKPRMLGKVIRKGCGDLVVSWNEEGRIHPDRVSGGGGGAGPGSWVYCPVVDDHDIMLGHSSFHNVYSDLVSAPYGSKELADNKKGHQRLGVVEINVYEGKITTEVYE
jgi:hypothetical protein